MMKRAAEDSTGKGKFVENKARTRAMLGFFVLGLCIGIVIAERIYIGRGGSVPKPKMLQTDYDRHHCRGTTSAKCVLNTREGDAQTTSSKDKASVSGDPAAIIPTSEDKPPRDDLEALLRKIAPTHEVLVAVANDNVIWTETLIYFLNSVKKSGIKNYLVMALDKETKDWCDEQGFNAYQLNITIHKVQQDTGDNHAVSAMKFGILKRFVSLGWAVLLSDVDICILQNPFEHLYRDSDVEGQTDGFDDPTAYGSIEGFVDKSMGWAQFAQYYKHFNLNSGFFYLKANNRTLDLLTRLEDRLSKTKYWDQTAYNEEIFFLSHGSYKSPQVTVRVLDIDKFMNSKRLFKHIRHLPKAQQPPKPVMVHINYHPDKLERMKAVFAYYNEGKDDIMKFPGGSEVGSR